MYKFLISFSIFISILSIADAKNESKESVPSGVDIKINETDVKILRKASEILLKSSAWNRKDNRECPVKAAIKLSRMFCC